VSYFFFLSFREISVVKVKKKTFAIMLMLFAEKCVCRTYEDFVTRRCIPYWFLRAFAS